MWKSGRTDLIEIINGDGIKSRECMFFPSVTGLNLKREVMYELEEEEERHEMNGGIFRWQAPTYRYPP